VNGISHLERVDGMVRTRITIALASALLVGAVVATPAAGAIIIEGCSGTCGYWEVKDTGPTGPKGAVCGYEKISYDLDFISVRPPLMHGNYSNKSKVAWRYKVRRATTSGGSYSTFYTSTWQTAMANNAIPAYAGQGFSRRYWWAPENPTGFFDIWIELSWYNPAGSAVEGQGTANYEWFKKLWNGNSYVEMYRCLQDY
jgi:hypothetical protein